MDPPAAADAAELRSSADTPSNEPNVIVEPGTCAGGAAIAVPVAKRVLGGEIGTVGMVSLIEAEEEAEEVSSGVY